MKSTLSKMHTIWMATQVSSSSTPLLSRLQVSPSSSSTTAWTQQTKGSWTPPWRNMQVHGSRSSQQNPSPPFPSDKMVIALRLFLGIPLQKDVKECPICRKRIDGFNVHMLICSTKKSLIQCHDAIKHCVKELFAMQLSSMLMLRHLPLRRETTVARRTRGAQISSPTT